MSTRWKRYISNDFEYVLRKIRSILLANLVMLLVMQLMTKNVVTSILLVRYLCPDSWSLSTSYQIESTPDFIESIPPYEHCEWVSPHGISKRRPMIIDRTRHFANTSPRHRLICTKHLLDVTFNFFVVVWITVRHLHVFVHSVDSVQRRVRLFSLNAYESVWVRWTWVRSALKERNWMKNFGRFWLWNNFQILTFDEEESRRNVTRCVPSNSFQKSIHHIHFILMSYRCRLTFISALIQIPYDWFDMNSVAVQCVHHHQQHHAVKWFRIYIAIGDLLIDMSSCAPVHQLTFGKRHSTTTTATTSTTVPSK